MTKLVYSVPVTCRDCGLETELKLLASGVKEIIPAAGPNCRHKSVARCPALHKAFLIARIALRGPPISGR
jgi:hypothetical protein